MTKNKIIMIAVGAVLLLSIVVGIGVSSINSPYEKQLALGYKYLEEGNYEEAILAFNKAIEIAPKKYEAYLALSDTYVAMGDFENARKALEKGIEVTKSKQLQEALLRLLNMEKNNLSTFKLLGAENVISSDNAEFAGYKLHEVDMSLFRDILSSEGYRIDNMDNETTLWSSAIKELGWYDQNNGISLMTSNVIAQQNIAENKIHLLWYECDRGGYWHSQEESIGFCGINTCDSLSTVLSKLGFTNAFEVAQEINSYANKVYASENEENKEFEKIRMISVDSNEILERVSVDSRTNLGEEGTVMVQAVNLQFDFVNGDTIQFRFSNPETLQNGFYDCLSEAEFTLNSNR